MTLITTKKKKRHTEVKANDPDLAFVDPENFHLHLHPHRHLHQNKKPVNMDEKKKREADLIII